MLEKESLNIVIAIAFTTSMIVLVVSMYGYHLVSSGKRLKKAQQFADAAIESTPAFMTIVFDEHDRVAVLKVHSPASEMYFREAFTGKKKQELGSLPEELRNPPSAETGSPSGHENGKTTTPLNMPDGSILFIEWKMQNFTSKNGKTEFKFAQGYDITTELLQTQKKLKVLSATSTEVEERERKRIAEDLHDRIGEILITSSRLIEELKKKSPSPDISQGLDELDRTIDKFTKGTRSLISDLVPPVLYSVGLVAAIESLAEECKRQHNVAIHVEDAWQDFQANQEISIFLYKAVREFIHNSIKHGGADEIMASFARTDHTLTVIVQDNGSGFALEANQLTLNPDSGFGLFNIKNRAEYYGGGIEIAASTDLGGGQIKVWVAQ